METKKKIYDFPIEKVRSQVISAFRHHGSSGTVSDVMGATGLPKYQVETAVKSVAADCRGQMAVTESGDIVYRFPQGFSNPQKNPWKNILRWTAKGLTALFKAWIMVMLVGYFVLFLLILIIALIISIALSFMRRDDDQEGAAVGEFMGFFMVGRVMEFFLLLWLFSGDVENKSQKKKKPFHKAIFEFVFGIEEKPEVREKAERKAFISFVRRNKGIVSLEELMALTGRSRREADILISRLLLEFEGEPKVSESGTLHFSFPELMKTSGNNEKEYRLSDQELIPFSRNPTKTNNWIIGINAFNIVLGLYFLIFGLQGFETVQHFHDNLSIVYLITVVIVSAFGHMTAAAANTWLTIVLGVVPVLYSGFFFGIPAVRRLQEGIKNLGIATNNFRKKLVAAVLARPKEVRLDQIEPDSQRNAPGKPSARAALKESLLQDLAGNRPLDVSGDGPYIYSLPELERETKDLETVRKNTDLSKFSLGKIVFDSEDRVE